MREQHPITPAVSDLVRQAEANLRNEQRLRAWRIRYLYRFGTTPDHDPALKHKRGFWHVWNMRQIMRGKGPEPKAPPRLRAVHGNANIVKFPRRKRQYMHTHLPTGPEAA